LKSIRKIVLESRDNVFFKFCSILLCTFVSCHFDVQTVGENLCEICTSVDKQNVHFGSLHDRLHPVIILLCVYFHVTVK
jgi:hypothetical protein